MLESLINLAQIETTTACPAHCPMCPRAFQSRSNGRMETELVYSAIEQVVAAGAQQVLPFINGEPLADNRMLDIVDFVPKHYPGIQVGFYTNAALLDEVAAERLIASGALRSFNISMQGGTKEVYERNMGLSWDLVIANVERFIKINERHGKPLEVRMNMCVFAATRDTVPEFEKRWSELGCNVCLGCFSNFGGLVHDSDSEAQWADKPRRVCYRAMNHAYVYWNGDVGQCCFDLMGSIVYGNLHDQTLASILSSPKHLAMREAHKNLDVDGMPTICRNCNSPKFNG